MTSAFVVATENLPRAMVGGVDDPSVRWAGAFATYGGHGATQSSTIVYEIEPGRRLGWPLFFPRGAEIVLSRWNDSAAAYFAKYEWSGFYELMATAE